MKKQPLLYVLLGVLIVIFFGAFVVILQSSNDAASDLLSGLQQAASNAYQQQEQPVIQQSQPTQVYYEQPTYQQEIPTQPTVSQPVTQVYSNPAAVLDVTASKQEILDAMCSAVNSVKTARNFGAVKYQNIDIKLDSCSVSFIVPVANSVIDAFTGEETLQYQFIDGTCIGPKSGEPVTPNLVIPPSDKLFALDGNGITSAVVTKDGFDTTYSISLVAETATLENPSPYYHSLCMDYLDYNALGIPIGKMTKADYGYPGATVNVTVNQIGQIIRYEEYMPLTAYGEGSLGFSATGSMSGYLHEIWTFTW